MFVTPAYAQAGGAGGGDIFGMLLPFVLIFVVMYFLIIRPQRQQAKKREEMLAAVRRGDTVVTGGGLVGKVTKVTNDHELEVDLGGGTKVTAVRSMLADVRVKGEPVANQNSPKSKK
ncbi:MAG: preprotein translocase subunit YajC [Rhizobiaceae bacterium]